MAFAIRPSSLTRLSALALCAAALAGPTTTRAASPDVTMDAVVSSLGADTWQAALTIANHSLASDLGAFTLYFPLGVYSNMAVVSSPGTWDSLVVQPDAALVSDGFFDSQVLNPPDALQPGQSQGGFVVRFDHLGAPGATLAFEVRDAAFQVLYAGNAQVSVVPEPASWALMLGGVALLVGRLQRRRAAAVEVL